MVQLLYAYARNNSLCLFVIIEMLCLFYDRNATLHNRNNSCLLFICYARNNGYDRNNQDSAGSGGATWTPACTPWCTATSGTRRTTIQ